MHGSSNKIHNQVEIGIKSHKTISSETKQTKTIDVTLLMKTKNSRRFQITTNRMETKTDKVDPAAAFHTGSKGIKIVFTISQ